MSPLDAAIRSYADYKTVRVPAEEFAEVRQIASAVDLLKAIQSAPFDNSRWAFRGQRRASWRLQPTMERLANECHITPYVERLVLREFKRRAHHHLHYPPEEPETLEWLALAQHHGAPTRLLDWTLSAYVAAFFAAESATPDEPFAVWAIDHISIKTEALDILELKEPDADLSAHENFNRIYRNDLPDDVYLVVPVRPYRMNERLTAQQGLFLCANNVLMGFETNLNNVFRCAEQRKPSATKMGA
jgi:hypothetical protein